MLGSGEATNVTTLSEWTDFTSSPAVQSGKLAFERAGLTPNDVDVCQIYDAFTSMVLLSLEALGFCGKGEGGPFVEDGKLRVGGALPTNTDGGGLSACHPGMRGMFLMVEAVKQLRGEAGDRQVPDAEDRVRERHRRLVQLRFDVVARRRLTGAPNIPRCSIVVSTSTTASSENSTSRDDVKYANRSIIASITALARAGSGR